MLIEMAACSAAYSTIKQFVGSGRELIDCSAAVISYFDNKSALAKRVENSTGPKNELEEFLALEKINYLHFFSRLKISRILHEVKNLVAYRLQLNNLMANT